MSDKDKTVESTISLSLKPKSHANIPTTKEPSTTQETVREEANGVDAEDSENKRVTSTAEKKPLPTYLKPKSTVKQTLLSSMPLFLGIAITLIIVGGLFSLGTYISNTGNHYYVESTISLPSDSETEQEALVLSSCVIDYTTEANPKEMIGLVHEKYNYLKGENDLVQNLVSSGCDLTVNPPIIKIGSLTQAIF